MHWSKCSWRPRASLGWNKNYRGGHSHWSSVSPTASKIPYSNPLRLLRTVDWSLHAERTWCAWHAGRRFLKPRHRKGLWAHWTEPTQGANTLNMFMTSRPGLYTIRVIKSPSALIMEPSLPWQMAISLLIARQEHRFISIKGHWTSMPLCCRVCKPLMWTTTETSDQSTRAFLP